MYEHKILRKKGESARFKLADEEQLWIALKWYALAR